MTCVEVDMVVSDSRAALALYEKIFETKRIEVTSFGQGFNEAVFSIYGTRFHLLDENSQYQLAAPKPGDPKPMWVNVIVPDIKAVFGKALAAGCTETQSITEMPGFDVVNATFSDPFGYSWMLHEHKHKAAFGERNDIFEKDTKLC
ncbi:MAG: VOC family protein [Spirochaetaceae bacterium]|nr:VOC family protein [Spirochaetaceae bacterium]